MFAQSVANVLSNASQFAILALAFVFVFRMSGFIDVTLAVPYVLAPYVVLGVVRCGFSLFPACCIGVLVALAAAMAINVGVFRPLKKRQASPLVLLVASLGAYTVAVNVLSLSFGDDPTTLTVNDGTRVFSFSNVRMTEWQLLAVASAAVCFALAYVGASLTRIGKAYRAIGSDIDLATSTGLPVDRMSIVGLAVASCVAAYAGILASLDTGMEPNMGLNALLMAIVIAIMGGSIASIRLLGAAIVPGVAQTAGAWVVSSQWQNTIAFAILLALLLIRPSALGRLKQPLVMM